MNQPFSFHPTEIEGLVLVKPFVACDVRGHFLKDYSREVFAQNGYDYDLKEVFYTSSHQGVIRAVHFQRVRTQPKLVRCISGRIFDVAVDLRKGSETFGRWQGFELSGDSKDELLIPGWCGHGYLVIEPAIVSYKCAEKFYGEYDDGILWNDVDLGIRWPLERIGGADRVILADKDKNLQSFLSFQKTYGGL